ncbi:uncharacterized protein TNCV_4604161 [Trichonephila clavipes]|nr:uncharacterized protein TNCV_4604161 [Trichonephila clavipes]
MVSLAVMSGGKAEFSKQSAPWAITQNKNSIPPRLMGNTVIEVFLSPDDDNNPVCPVLWDYYQENSSGIAEDNSSCPSGSAVGSEVWESQRFHRQAQCSDHRDVEEKKLGESICLKAIRQEGSIGKDSKPLWFGGVQYRYRIVAGLVTSSSPVPLKTRLGGQRCTLNLSRAEASSRWCGMVVRRGGWCQLRCRPRHLTMVQNDVLNSATLIFTHAGCAQTTRNRSEMLGRCSCELWCKETEKKKRHIDGKENILLKGCTATGVRNNNQKSSDKPHSGAARNSYCCF